MTGIVALAQRCSQYGDASQRLGELLGEWARADSHPAAAAMFAAHCHHLTWHATLFADRRPVSPADVAAPGAWAPFEAALAAAAEAGSTAARVRAAYDGVATLLVAAYQQHLAATDPRVDGPTARVLTLALRDLDADLLEAAALASTLG